MVKPRISKTRRMRKTSRRLKNRTRRYSRGGNKTKHSASIHPAGYVYKYSPPAYTVPKSSLHTFTVDTPRESYKRGITSSKPKPGDWAKKNNVPIERHF